MGIRGTTLAQMATILAQSDATNTHDMALLVLNYARSIGLAPALTAELHGTVTAAYRAAPGRDGAATGLALQAHSAATAAQTNATAAAAVAQANAASTLSTAPPMMMRPPLLDILNTCVLVRT